jgi:nucleotide-binding universal stress UspA family protein
MIMHIINMPVAEEDKSMVSFHDVPEGMLLIKLTKKKFAKLLQMDYLQGLEVETVVAYNTVYETISEKAKKYDADLVIMGSHGTSGLGDFIGSNTERVVRTSEVPIMVIKNDQTDLKFDNIVFASNFKEESYGVFHKVQQFASNFETTVHLLKINTPNYFESTSASNEAIDTFIDQVGLKVNHTVNIYNDTTIEEGIQNFAKSINADLIVMETHGRTGIKHLLWGSITENVVNHSDIPVMSVKIV